jgi:hypothetical protein
MTTFRAADLLRRTAMTVVQVLHARVELADQIMDPIVKFFCIERPSPTLDRPCAELVDGDLLAIGNAGGHPAALKHFPEDCRVDHLPLGWTH